MGAKVIRDPRLRARAEQSRRKRKGRPLSGAEAAAEGATTTVVCEAAPTPEKKKFPLGPVLITGFITAVGGIIAYRGYQKFFVEKKEEEERAVSAISGATLNPAQQRAIDARNALLLSAPTAAQAAQVQQQQQAAAMGALLAANNPMAPEPTMVIAPPARHTDPEEVLSYMDAYVQQFDEE